MPPEVQKALAALAKAQAAAVEHGGTVGPDQAQALRLAGFGGQITNALGDEARLDRRAARRVYDDGDSRRRLDLEGALEQGPDAGDVEAPGALVGRDHALQADNGNDRRALAREALEKSLDRVGHPAPSRRRPRFRGDGQQLPVETGLATEDGVECGHEVAAIGAVQGA